jgi:hypothetical protein
LRPPEFSQSLLEKWSYSGMRRNTVELMRFRARIEQVQATATRCKVVHFDNQRRTAEQWIREDKHAVGWTRLSCRGLDINQVRRRRNRRSTRDVPENFLRAGPFGRQFVKQNQLEPYKINAF